MVIEVNISLSKTKKASKMEAFFDVLSKSYFSIFSKYFK